MLAVQHGNRPQRHFKFRRLGFVVSCSDAVPRGPLHPEAMAGDTGLPSTDHFWQNWTALYNVTLEALRAHFAGRVDCSIVAIHNALRRLDYRFKKSRYERVSKTAPT